ncbi:MAG: DUF1214 domain-containing protein [Pseudochelatococcus sp.]|uniref:DUF1214 domain-containing protein n=1 Tax=Pseudochelatococcus sp. TaxID=2020869 RepID=UPI003D8A0CA2
MRTILVALATLAIAAFAGLGSAWYMTRGEPPFGAVRAGPWAAWPDIGSPVIDPYARAIVARTGALPLGAGEGLELHAVHDSEGRPLDGACVYAVRGAVPSARAWTLTVYDAAGGLPPNETGRNGFTSFELLRDADGMAEIVLSRGVRPGNWLMLPPTEGVHLVLRLYGAPLAAVSGVVEAAALPAIDRLACP